MDKKSTARSSKSTFWNELRVKNGYSYQDLADTLGHDMSVVGKWFTGHTVPKEKSLRELCDLFGVDYALGKEEFVKACEAKKSAKRKNSKHTSNVKKSTTVAVVPKKDADSDAGIFKDGPIEAIESSILKKVLKSVYNKLDFDDYEDLRTRMLEGGDPREILYKKISFEDYIEFAYSLKDM